MAGEGDAMGTLDTPPRNCIEFRLQGGVTRANVGRHLDALRTWQELWLELHAGEPLLVNLRDARIDDDAAAALADFFLTAGDTSEELRISGAPAAMRRALGHAATDAGDGPLVLRGA